MNDCHLPADVLAHPPAACQPLQGALLIPISLLTPSPLNPRKRWTTERVARMVASLKTSGQVQPIRVRPNPLYRPGNGRVWRAGPRLSSWKPEARIEKRPELRGGRRARLPALDASKLAVAQGARPPIAQNRKGATLHDAIFDLLTEDGQHVPNIPIGYRGSMGKAVQTYLAQRPELRARSAILVRTIDNKTIGLWRVARTDPILAGGDGQLVSRRAKLKAA